LIGGQPARNQPDWTICADPRISGNGVSSLLLGTNQILDAVFFLLRINDMQIQIRSRFSLEA
jgi:hypothetical protein